MSDKANKNEIMDSPEFDQDAPSKSQNELVNTPKNDFAPSYEQSLRIEQYIRDHGLFSLPSKDEDQSLSGF